MSLPEIKIIPKNTGKLTITETVPPALTSYLIPGAQATVIAGEFGYFLLQKISVASYAVWYNNFFLECEESFRVIASGPMLILQFFLRNSFFVEAEETLLFLEGRYNLAYLPNADHEVRFLKGLYTHVCIEYPFQTLTEMAEIYPAMNSFIKKTAQDKPVFLYPVHPFITIGMKTNIETLLYCDYNEGVKDRLLKAKILELLFEVMERITHAPVSNAVDLTSEEVIQINMVRDLLDSQLNKVISKYELARQAGMNEHKLSAAFKYIFGVSISEYHITARMKAAENLLRDTNDSIDEIAESVGYATAKSFIKEFSKRHKNITPNKYRKYSIN